MGSSKKCEYCERSENESDFVCRHVPYEETGYLSPCDPASSSESKYEYESTDVEMNSDEDGSWFTTPWTKLFPECPSDDLNLEIGVKLFPVEEIPEKEAKINSHIPRKRLCSRRKRTIHRKNRKQTQCPEPSREGQEEPKKT